MKRWIALTTLTLAMASRLATAADLPTARQAVDLANKRMSPQAQNQVLRIEGRHSDPQLRIRQWEVTFYDGTRVNNALTVRVEDGQVTSESSPLRMFEDGTWGHFDRNFTGFSNKEVINLSRWKIDSDSALSKVLKLPRLSEVQITEVRMLLRKLSDGDVPPVWRIHLRARSKTDPSRETGIGYADLNAESGEILRNETRVGKLLK